MFSIDDAYNPVMHQDLMNSSMGFVNPMMCMYPYNTNLLGGARIQQQPMQDKYEAISKKDSECKKNFKNAFKALGWMTLGGFIPPARKYIKNAGGLGKAITQLGNSAWQCLKKVF